MSVKAGVTDMMPTELEHRQETTSVEVIVHPRFRPMKLGGFDIGLIRVSPRFNFSDVIFQVEISEKGMIHSDWCFLTIFVVKNKRFT